MRHFLSSLTTWLLTCLALTGWAQQSVRVLIDEVDSSVLVQMDSPHRGYVDGVLRFSTGAGLAWPLQAAGSYVYAEGQPIGHSFTVEPSDGSVVMWQGEAYRGSLRFVAVERGFKVVNVLDLEDYLRGVVPAEMQASWSLEAVKAQAVAARTYTLASLQPEADFDVCATIECQKYSGVDAEHLRSDQAIAETSGVVLRYGDAFAKTYYHSDSGGVLASSAEVWGNARPYLVAQQDVAHTSPHRQWEYTLDPDLIAASLRARGQDVGAVSGLSITAYTESGRVAGLAVTGSGGAAELSGTDLTRVLRQWGLKSTRFSMTGAMSVVGDGWGHGVGMSQHGARALARAGYDYSQILAFYYPGAQLQKLDYIAE